jgi:hypothetical protein
MMGSSAYAACFLLAFWPGLVPLQHDHYYTAHYPLQAEFYSSISASLFAVCFQIRSYAVRARLLRLGPCPVLAPVLRGFEFGSKSFNYQVKSQHRRRHLRRHHRIPSAKSSSSSQDTKMSAIATFTLGMMQYQILEQETAGAAGTMDDK